MPAQPIILKPGVTSQQTPLLAAATYVSSNYIRFKDGLLQKKGGFSNYVNDSYQGQCRGLFAWQDIPGNQYVACGTNTELDVIVAGNLYNITPIASSHTLTAPFTFTMGSAEVTVNATTSDLAEGQEINIVNRCSVNTADGILWGPYTVSQIVDSTHFKFTNSSVAASTASGGSAAFFTTVMSSSSVQVTLAGVGNVFVIGDSYTVDISTSVGGLTLFGSYSVTGVTDANNIVIDAAASASSAATNYESGANHIVINYLLPPGLESVSAGASFGSGPFGSGLYSYGVLSGSETPLRQWFFGSWSITSQLIASPTNGAIYEWDPSLGLISNNAAIISQAPIYNTAIFVAMPEIQIVALGAESGGTQDPLLIRWCDSGDYTVWTATSDNQAGSFRLPRGSRIVGGTQGPQQGLIWTDLALWAQSYIQPPLVYGFNEISTGCGLISARAFGILNNRVYWMSQNGFFVYDGSSVQPFPCSVWDIVFRNLNTLQQDKITCTPNSAFNELKWSFPSASGDGEVDAYVNMNSENPSQPIWDYSSSGFDTAGFDQSVVGPPIGAHSSTQTVVQYETQDGTGGTINSFAQTGYFKLSEGLLYIFVERMIPDFKFGDSDAVLYLSVLFTDYPSDTPRVVGPFTVTPTTEWIIVRGRGRLASIYIEDNFGNSFWRIGEPLYFGAPAGRR